MNLSQFHPNHVVIGGKTYEITLQAWCVEGPEFSLKGLEDLSVREIKLQMWRWYYESKERTRQDGRKLAYMKARYKVLLDTIEELKCSMACVSAIECDADIKMPMIAQMMNRLMELRKEVDLLKFE